jgi:hypothetical protein
MVNQEVAAKWLNSASVRCTEPTTNKLENSRKYAEIGLIMMQSSAFD